MPLRKRLTSHQGFTLVELLVSLAILGVLATFTIPKILSTQQDSRKKTVFRETIAAVEALVYEKIYVRGDTNSQSTDIILDNINAARICKTNGFAQGCWQVNADPTPGALLHNGATIESVDGWVYNWPVAGCKVDGIFVDWNGDAGPNLDGDDRLALIINASNQTCNGVPPFRIRQWNGGYLALYSWIWE